MDFEGIAPVAISERVQSILARFERTPIGTSTSGTQLFKSSLDRAMDTGARVTRRESPGVVDPRVYATLSTVGLVPSVANGDVPATASQYRALLSDVARREGVPLDLLAAVAWTESNFRPEALSHAGATGMMQLMPGTAAELGVDPANLVENVTGGARYLRQMLDRFGRVDLALAAYNAGPGSVDRHGGIPPFEETQNYVQKVLARRELLGDVAW